MPTTGVRFALEAGGTAGTVPVRVAFAGVALSAVIAVAAATVGASLDEVDREPARRGAYGDLVLGNAASPAAADAIADRLARHPDVAGFAGEAPNEVDIDGRTTWVVALFGGPGELTPRVVAGRPPREADEIALGGPVLRDLGVGVGDTVEVTFTAEPVEMRVVGQSLVDDVDGSNGGPGKSGLVDASALPVLDPDGVDSTAPVWFVVDLRPDVDRGAALARLRQDFPNVVTTSRMPTDLRNLERLQGLVALLAVLVGLLGSGASLLALIGAVTRRRRELAVLRTLGFARRQAAAVVAWQATTFAVVGLVVGLPLGLALGRQGWIAVAEVLGIRPSPIVPVGVVLAVATATVVALNLVATLPAWVAGRVRPAEELRSE